MGLGFTEIIILAAIALVVMGPEKFPDFAKIVIRTVRDVRGYMNDVSSEVTKELRPVQRELDKLTRETNTYTPAKPVPKPAAAAEPVSNAPETQVDAQNVVDPAVADEQPPQAAKVAAGIDNGNGTQKAADNYHRQAEQYPD